MMIDSRATSRAVKVTGDQALLESDTKRRLEEAPNSLIGITKSTKEEYAFKPRRRLERSPIVKEKLVGEDSEMEVDSQAELTDQNSCLTPRTSRIRNGGK